MKFESRLEQANTRLRNGNVGVRLEIRGDRLYLRATFPPRPGSGKTAPFQQRLGLGHRANPLGLKAAENSAKVIGGLLSAEKFDWTPYLKKKETATPQTCGDWVARLHDQYIAEGGGESTWNGDYWKIFKKLDLDEPLSVEILHDLILSIAPNTKTRQRACMAIGVLAKFAKLDYSPSSYRGSYSPDEVNPRELPSDDLIIEWWEKLENPGWKWVYGMMATYGLRNHEVFRLDFDLLREGDDIANVLKPTKTGRRKVWGFYPEWWDLFDLKNVQLPAVNLERTNASLGHSVSEYFLDSGIPFSPYNLRHCWAVRTLILGVPWQLAAKQMGHSAQVHERTYHRWIKDDVNQKIHDAIKRDRSPGIIKD